MTTDATDNLCEIAREISNLPVNVQKMFMTALSGFIADEDVIMELVYTMLSRTKRYEKLTHWMDQRFQKDMSITPARIAREAVYYLKINSKMVPFLIKTAQKIKDRVRHRISYEAQK